jgi:hypothetical protein
MYISSNKKHEADIYSYDLDGQNKKTVLKHGLQKSLATFTVNILPCPHAESMFDILGNFCN